MLTIQGPASPTTGNHLLQWTLTHFVTCSSGTLEYLGMLGTCFLTSGRGLVGMGELPDDTRALPQNIPPISDC